MALGWAMCCACPCRTTRRHPVQPGYGYVRNNYSDQERVMARTSLVARLLVPITVLFSSFYHVPPRGPRIRIASNVYVLRVVVFSNVSSPI